MLAGLQRKKKTMAKRVENEPISAPLKKCRFNSYPGGAGKV
jgi:hypothetical protein